MTPGNISRRVTGDRLAWVRQMLVDLRSLPLDDRDQFLADRRNVWTAESCLRRALEALLDLGRHLLAKGFGQGVTEYKEIADQLLAHGVLNPTDGKLLSVLAGYRNRLVHFYHEVEPDELYDVCARNLGDVERLTQAFEDWLRQHPDDLDESL